MQTFISMEDKISPVSEYSHCMSYVFGKRKKKKKSQKEKKGKAREARVSVVTRGRRGPPGVPLHLVKFFCILELCVPNY